MLPSDLRGAHTTPWLLPGYFCSFVRRNTLSAARMRHIAVRRAHCTTDQRRLTGCRLKSIRLSYLASKRSVAQRRLRGNMESLGTKPHLRASKLEVDLDSIRRLYPLDIPFENVGQPPSASSGQPRAAGPGHRVAVDLTRAESRGNLDRSHFDGSIEIVAR